MIQLLSAKNMNNLQIAHWQFILLWATLFLLPFGLHGVSFIMLAYVVLELVRLIKERPANRLRAHPWLLAYFVAIVIYMLLLSYSITYSSQRERAFQTVFQKLPILLSALFFSFRNEILHRKRLGLLEAFVLGNLAAGLMCLVVATYNSVDWTSAGLIFDSGRNAAYKNRSFLELLPTGSSYFTYAWLSVFMHPSYFAMFVAFAIAAVFYLLKNAGYTPKQRLFYKTLPPFFILLIFLLGSRAGYIGGIMVVLTTLVIQIFHFRKVGKGLLFLLTFISVVVILAPYSRFYRQKKKQEPKTEQQTKPSEEKKTKDEAALSGKRLIIWDSALSLIKQKVWLGHGGGDVKYILGKANPDYMKAEKLKHGIDAHNAFLDIWLAAGVFGLLALLLSLGIPWFYAILNQRMLLFILILLLGINLAFESMLNRQSGIWFTALLLNALLFFFDPPQKSSPEMP